MLNNSSYEYSQNIVYFEVKYVLSDGTESTLVSTIETHTSPNDCTIRKTSLYPPC